MSRRHRQLVLSAALWVLAADALLLVPMALRTRQLRQSWAAWNTAAAANLALVSRAAGPDTQVDP